MKREAIVEAVETYLRQWNGCAATVLDITRFRTYSNEDQAVVTVGEGDARWALRVGLQDGAIVVLDDSLPTGDQLTAFVKGLV